MSHSTPLAHTVCFQWKMLICKDGGLMVSYVSSQDKATKKEKKQQQQQKNTVLRADRPTK